MNDIYLIIAVCVALILNLAGFLWSIRRQNEKYRRRSRIIAEAYSTQDGEIRRYNPTSGPSAIIDQIRREENRRGPHY